MDIRKLTDDFSVSPQVDVAHMREIAGAGFKSIMCNRPDQEDPGQPDYDAIADAAIAEGLEVAWIPVVGGMLGPDALTEFDRALADMPRPMLAYCRSGTRCTTLWAVTQHGRMDDAEIIERAAKAGYDMSGLIMQMSQRGT
ncbi:MAG: TIGR01244 family sulfur transferase [Pseudomonadota bacterium]